jgi:hypothetical protein
MVRPLRLAPPVLRLWFCEGRPQPKLPAPTYLPSVPKGVSLSMTDVTVSVAAVILHSHCNQPLRRSSNVPETHVRTVVGYTASGCGPEGHGFEPRRSPKLEVP